MAAWTANQWSMLRYPHADLKAALHTYGYEVHGFVNGKPVIHGNVDWGLVELIAHAVAAGTWAPPEETPEVSLKRKRGRPRGRD